MSDAELAGTGPQDIREDFVMIDLRGEFYGQYLVNRSIRQNPGAITHGKT